MQFSIGDKVKVLGNIPSLWPYRELIGTIKAIDLNHIFAYFVVFPRAATYFKAEELEKVE